MTNFELTERIETLTIIVEDYLLRGETDPGKIAKAMGMPRKDVVVYIDEWKSIARNNSGLQDRARELVSEMDRSYDLIIKELWIALEEAENVRDKNTTLKNIADVTAKRQEALQKAGLYDDAAIGEEMALVEEQVEAIKQLLQRVVKEHPETKITIMEGLGRIFNKSEPIPEADVE